LVPPFSAPDRVILLLRERRSQQLVDAPLEGSALIVVPIDRPGKLDER
jgi:hypothetical protein